MWIRVTPQRLGYGGYRVVGQDVELTLAMVATTEGYVGDRPEPFAPTPLPPPSLATPATGLRVRLPVVADYRELEPVVLKALTKLNVRGIDLPALGRVEAAFLRATIYPTEGGRLALGVETEAPLPASRGAPVGGSVWLAAVPVNAPGATRVEWRDLEMTARTDRRGLNLLIELFDSPAVREEIRAALALNLEGDYQQLLAKARAAIADKPVGDVVLAATIDEVTHGQLMVAGQGLYLPVTARGHAVLRVPPTALASRLQGGRPARARRAQPNGGRRVQARRRRAACPAVDRPRP